VAVEGLVPVWSVWTKEKEGYGKEKCESGPLFFVARRKFLTEIVTCRIAESLDLKWLEDSVFEADPHGKSAILSPFAALEVCSM
jgi:hypothetical protein